MPKPMPTHSFTMLRTWPTEREASHRANATPSRLMTMFVSITPSNIPTGIPQLSMRNVMTSCV
jgi:hypothetical protein